LQLKKFEVKVAMAKCKGTLLLRWSNSLTFTP